VLNIFLPVVVFVFGLFALLRLKFCIPPSFQLSADLTAALQTKAGGVDIDADLNIQASIASFLDATLGAPAGANATASFANSALLDLVAELAKPPAPAAGTGGGLPGASGSACAALDGGTA